MSNSELGDPAQSLENIQIMVTENQTTQVNYQLLRLHLYSIPHYEGNPHTLDIFLDNCENLIAAFASVTDNRLNIFLFNVSH